MQQSTVINAIRNNSSLVIKGRKYTASDGVLRCVVRTDTNSVLYLIGTPDYVDSYVRRLQLADINVYLSTQVVVNRQLGLLQFVELQRSL